MLSIQRISRNTTTHGRDWIVGDIHGHFTKLEKALHEVGFSSKLGDRLFFLGDLIDRGPESMEVLSWLAKPWVYSVLGNHEDLAILYFQGLLRSDICVQNGGQWFVDLPYSEQERIVSKLMELPLAIELETSTKTLGLIHANVPYGNWEAFKEISRRSGAEQLHCYSYAIWDRSRVAGNALEQTVKGIDAVLVGHSRVAKPKWIGNVLHIDTCSGDSSAPFCLVEAETLETHLVTPF